MSDFINDDMNEKIEEEIEEDFVKSKKDRNGKLNEFEIKEKRKYKTILLQRCTSK